MMILLALCLLCASPAPADDALRAPDDEWERIVDLRGTWKFSLGDALAWADPDVADKEWEAVFVPARWEEEGFWGYDGYAWYRKHFYLPQEAKGRSLYLDAGRIDDVSAVYINGHFIGSAGRFPPEFQTGYHVFSRYRIPAEYLQVGGSNVVAIRVFDTGGEGGLVEGKPGLYANPDEPMLAVDLAGPWAFRTGDRLQGRFDDDEAKWDEMMVPGRWEPQGYAEYDGFAWYRKRFYMPAFDQGEDLVLVLGKIDDLDETYLNGVLIGATGRMKSRTIEGWEWQEVRTYPIPNDALRFGADNVLTVRVYDGLYDGGIYEGPIGIVRQGEVERWKVSSQEIPRGLWKTLLDWFFQEDN